MVVAGLCRPVVNIRNMATTATGESSGRRFGDRKSCELYGRLYWTNQGTAFESVLGPHMLHPAHQNQDKTDCSGAARLDPAGPGRKLVPRSKVWPNWSLKTKLVEHCQA